MKEKIRLALVNKYKNLGFSDKAIEGILGYLESTVTAEDQIEGAVNAVEPMLKAFQAEVDSRVGTAVAKVKTPAPDPANPEGPKKEEPVTPPADAPEWAKGLLTVVTTLQSELKTIKEGKSTDTRKTQLEEALKDTPEAYKSTIMKAFNRMKFDKDEDFTTYLEEVQADSAAFVQESANNGLSQVKAPIKPAGAQSQVKQATPEEAANILKNM